MYSPNGNTNLRARDTGFNPVNGNGHFFFMPSALFSSFCDTHTHTHTHTHRHTHTHTHTHIHTHPPSHTHKHTQKRHSYEHFYKYGFSVSGSVQIHIPADFKLYILSYLHCLSYLSLTENSTQGISWQTLKEISDEIKIRATDVVNLIEQLDYRCMIADRTFTRRNCRQTPNAIALLILEEWSSRSDTSGQKLFRILSSSSLADHEDFRLLTDQGKNQIHL